MRVFVFEVLPVAAFALFVVFQLALPALLNKPLFPLFRRKSQTDIAFDEAREKAVEAKKRTEIIKLRTEADRLEAEANRLYEERLARIFSDAQRTPGVVEHNEGDVKHPKGGHAAIDGRPIEKA